MKRASGKAQCAATGFAKGGLITAADVGYGYVAWRSKAEAGDLKALHLLLSQIERDLLSLSLFSVLPPNLSPVIGSLHDECKRAAQFVDGFNRGHDWAARKTARHSSRKRKVTT